MFEILKLKKKKNYHNKVPALLKDVHIEKVLASNKISFSEKSQKYFIGYLYNDNKVKPLHIMLPKTMAYLKSYDELTKWIYFWTEDDDLLKKCNTISNKVISDIKKSLIVSLSTKKSFKAEIKSHSD